MVQEIREKCDDYDGYKKRKGPKNFVQKGSRKVWKIDIERQAQLKCLDDAHSKTYGITEAELKKINDELIAHFKAKERQCCKYPELDVLLCLQNNTISQCAEEIKEFKKCVDYAVREIDRNAE